VVEDSVMLLWGVLFGGIGIGYFIYGKNKKYRSHSFQELVFLLFPI
jgi:hypothetical protein